VRTVHKLGYTHGDIRLENICIEINPLLENEYKLTLIGYGSAISFKD
jgi:hypothetical protein